MIKINLLPPGIFEARVIKRLIVLFSIILVGIVAGCMYYTSTVNKATEGYKAETAIAKEWRAKAEGYKSQADSELAKIGPIDAKLGFVKNVDTFNEVYPKLYEAMARYTYHKITYSQMTISPDGSVSITAHAPSLSDAGRYLLNMYRATELFASVAISNVPGYPADNAGGSMGGGLSFGASLPSATPSLSPAGGMMMSQAPLMGGSQPALPAMSPGGLGAVTTGLNRSPARQSGFNFTVSCTLRDPSILATPSPTGQSAAPGVMPGPGGGMSLGTAPLR